MVITEGLLASGGKEIFNVIVTDVYKLITEYSGRKIKQWNTEKKIESLYHKIEKVRKVKTIWQVDKAVDLTAFYCDNHVMVNKKRTKINQLADFRTDDNLLIQGIAGQGKSIFMRYLCGVELALGNYIPIFLELRRINKSYSLRDRIYMSFKSLGLDVDDKLFDTLAASGKIILLLDAFDEVPDNLKPSVLTDIEDLANTFDSLRIVASSRPNDKIQMSNQFTVVNLENLQDDEYTKVIHKLAEGENWADRLIDHIENHATHMLDLLCTPLMVTLLVLSYKSYQKLPNKMSDFYDSLFHTLLQRHDGTKPGFTRERACDLDDGRYRQVFERLCILAKNTREQSYSFSTIHELSKNALQQSSVNVNPDNYINDIVKITCLIIRDGEEHRFIHKTVQEYYTAAFISKQPESWAKIFYKKALSRQSIGEWSQELEFLSEIDEYTYNRYFLLPGILQFLKLKQVDLKQKCPRFSQKKFRDMTDSLYIRTDMGDVKGIGYMVIDSLHNFSMNFIRSVINKVQHLGLTNRLSTVDITKFVITSKKRKTLVNVYGGRHNFTEFWQLSDAAGVTDELVKELDGDFGEMFTRAQKLQISLQKAESTTLLNGLI